MHWLRKNSLPLSLLAALFFAWLTPSWGARDGHLHIQKWTTLGVVWIFFYQGYTLSSHSILKGIKSWKHHIYIQAWINIGIPLIALMGLQLLGKFIPQGLQLGIFFLAILPTTISSAVALVGEAEGNVSIAVFNATLSNLLAVFLLPLWIWWFQSNQIHSSIEIWPVFLKLIQILLLPFAFGHLSRIWLIQFEAHIKKKGKAVNQFIITLIVYSAFATSFNESVWEKVGYDIAITGLISAVALLLTCSLTVLLASNLLFKRTPDRIAIFMVSAQKSLAVGIPYSVAFFSTPTFSQDPTIVQSVIIIPILFYHPMQLLLAALLVRYKKRIF